MRTQLRHVQGDLDWLTNKDPSMKPKLDSLKAMFPQFSHDALQNLLVANEGCLKQTVRVCTPSAVSYVMLMPYWALLLAGLFADLCTQYLSISDQHMFSKTSSVLLVLACGRKPLHAEVHRCTELTPTLKVDHLVWRLAGCALTDARDQGSPEQDPRLQACEPHQAWSAERHAGSLSS